MDEARRQSAEALAQLADAVGLPASAMEVTTLSFDELNEARAELTTAEARRQAAVNRVDILAALAEYAASQAVLQLEIAKQYPDLHIAPGYQLDQTDNKWTLGATLTLPVLNQNRGAIAEASAHREGNQHWLVQCKSATDLCFGFCRVARENAPQHSGSKVPPPNVQLFPRIQQ